MIFLDLLIHIFVVHSPNAFFISVQLRVNDLTAVVGDGTSEADVGGGVDQDGLTRSSEGLQSGSNAAQNAVLVADSFLGHLSMMSVSMPLDDCIIVIIRNREVAVQRMLSTA